MKSLLKANDQRRLNMIELLIEVDGWITISNLAKELNSSTRVLKEDMTYLRKTYNAFLIETSHLGVRITIDQSSGLRDFYRQILETSLPFQVLRLIFFDESLTLSQVATKLHLSTSTMYRTIEQLNNYFSEKGCVVETSPCRLVGDEFYIRNFYRTYFKEVSTPIEWPFDGYDEESVNDSFDKILSFLSKETDVEAKNVDFAFYESIKLSVMVNLIRYENGNLVDTSDIENTLYTLLFHVVKLFANPLKGQKLTTEYIYQVFYTYLRKDAAFGKAPLVKLRKKNKTVDEALSFLEDSLQELADFIQVDFDVPDLSVAVHGTTFVERDDPNSQYILFNQHKIFAQSFQHGFPYIYESIFKAVVGYRSRLGLDMDEDKINYLIYIILTNWDNMLADLYRKYQRVNILVLSDGHYSHAKTIQKLLSFELRNNLEIGVYRHSKISEELLRDYDCDLIISTFNIPDLDNKETIVINYFPTAQDIVRIETLLSQIIHHKMTAPLENLGLM